MTDEPQPAEKPKLRWYQYRLWPLVIFVAVVCCILGFVGWYLPPRLEFHKTAAPIRELGASVGGNPGLGARGVKDVCLPYELTDADLKTLVEHLETLPGLKHLVLKQVTDDGLEHLKGPANLEGLSLIGTQITDAGLEHLKGLTNLKVLFLDDTQITDAGLVHFKELPKLKGLWIENTRVTDAGLRHLRKLTNLRRFSLGNTQITDAGLAHLEGLTNLKRLQA